MLSLDFGYSISQAKLGFQYKLFNETNREYILQKTIQTQVKPFIGEYKI